eukprot:9212_1
MDGKNKTQERRRHFVRLIPTNRFFIFDRRPPEGSDNCTKKLCVKLDVHDPYEARFVRRALARRPWVEIVDSYEHADLHWGDFEELAWEQILSGKLRGSAFCVRKGISRKAQLSMYLNKYITKTRGPKGKGDNKKSNILSSALPETLVIDTWEAFDETFTFNLGGHVASFGSHRGVVASMSLEKRLSWALEPAKDWMKDRLPGHFYLKPSTLNKGAEISMPDSFESLCKAVNANPSIRE